MSCIAVIDDEDRLSNSGESASLPGVCSPAVSISSVAASSSLMTVKSTVLDDGTTSLHPVFALTVTAIAERADSW
jgi:hypothetical protein